MACRLLRWTLRAAGGFRAALDVRLCAIPAVRLASLSALASLALAAVLFAIPADRARAHDVSTATHHATSHPLGNAVLAGDLDSVNHFITVHMADVNRASGSGATPLHYAANGGHAAIASVLIAAGADVNAKNNEDQTPLRWAAGGDYVTVVVLLLEAGADVDGRNDDDETPLHWAARNGRVAPVAALIAGGADVDAQDKDGDTPLHFAARFDRVAIVSLLIQATASLNVKNKDDKAPLHWAAEVGYPAVVSALIAEGADVNARDKDDKGPLHLADAGGHADIVAALIEAGAYWGDAACESGEIVNPAGPIPPCLCEPPTVGTAGNCAAPSKESCGGLDPAQFYDAAADACVPIVECAPPKVWHPGGNDCHVTSDYTLHDAVFAGDLDLVNHFITVHMADVNRRNGFQFTPLHLAADGGHAAIASVLIAAGADVNAKPANGNDFTPLRRAVAAGYATIIVLLIAAGADVDGSNQFGETSLHEAARDGRVAAVDALIAGGADVDAKDRDDATPLHFAASYGASGRAAIVSLLIQATASLNVKNEDGKAPLHLAAERGYAAVVAALIAAGAYWGDAACESGLATNPAGATPPCINLHQAAAGGHVFAVATLIATGATLDARDGDNNTPLHFAARNGRAAIVSLLIQATANLNVKNEDDKGPLHLADAGGHADIVAALIEAGAYWGDAVCRSGEVTNSAGPSPACAACAAPSVARARTNLCDCSAPNVGTDGAVAPGNCACPAGQPALYLGVCVASCPDEWMLDSGICVPSPAIKAAANATLLAEVQKSSADVSVVLRALDEGADANTATSAGIPVLVVAATMLHAEVVGILITAGADPTVKVDGLSHHYYSPGVDSRFIPEALLQLARLDFGRSDVRRATGTRLSDTLIRFGEAAGDRFDWQADARGGRTTGDWAFALAHDLHGHVSGFPELQGSAPLEAVLRYLLDRGVACPQSNLYSGFPIPSRLCVRPTCPATSGNIYSCSVCAGFPLRNQLYDGHDSESCVSRCGRNKVLDATTWPDGQCKCAHGGGGGTPVAGRNMTWR